jgi:ribosomal protein RSM22 (predicted rRNA methylase)
MAVVEPGTPAGYSRVLAAREALLAAGFRVVAPCPHQAPCPLREPDWCHFAVRINRSSLHRRVKGAQLGYEDEKFAYVVGIRDQLPQPPPARVLRHPVTRKGLVALRLCTREGTVAPETVSKRQGDRYRAARDLVWGDPWSYQEGHSLPGS